MKKVFCLLAAVICLIGSLPVALASGSVSAVFDVMEEDEFGEVTLDCTFTEFLQKGFQLGDSCDLELSSGFRMEDVPIFDGYYCRTDSPLIVLYPGYEHPNYTFSNTGDMWYYSGAKDGDTVTVTLRESGKYAGVQNAMSVESTNDRSEFDSDIEFSNFRELSGGKLRPGAFYRGASPVDDRNLRAACTDALIRQAGIGFILDLAETEEKAINYPFFPGSRFEELLSCGQVACLGLKSAYRSPEYAEKLADGLRRMIGQDQPVFIHCTEGKDRTGFVCILLEALAGAEYEEILRDYMITYDNYYGINETAAPEKYNAIVEIRFRDILDWLAGVPEGTDLSGQTFEQPARNYLASAGMTEDELAALTVFLISFP